MKSADALSPLRVSSLGLLALLLAGLQGCTVEDVVARQIDCPDGGCGVPSDCRGPDCPPQLDAGLCEAVEPRLSVGDTTCSSETLRGFRYGVCTCEDYVSQFPLTVAGLSGSGETGSVGTNGTLNATGGLSISGSLIVAGDRGIATGQSAEATIGGDLASQGVLSGGGRVDIGGDARVAGDIGVGALSVGGTLTTPSEATVSVSGEEQVGARSTAPVTVEPPCACDPAARPDLVGAILDHRADNDNRAAALGAFDLEGATAPATITLPCGAYHLSRISGSAPVTIRAADQVTLFIDGGIALDDSLVIETSGTVDVIVEEGVRIGGELRLGGSGGRVRLLVAGTGVVQLDADARIEGIVYAPEAELVTSGETRVYGALLARRAVAGGPVIVEQDTASDGCP